MLHTEMIKSFVKKYARAKRRINYIFSIYKIFHEIQNFDFIYPWSKGYASLTNDKRQFFAASLPTETTIPRLLFNFLYRKNRPVYWISIGSSQKNRNFEYFVRYVLPHQSKEFVLISTDGDRAIPNDLPQEYMKRLLSSKKLLVWYSQNLAIPNNNRVKFVPIGLDLHTNRGNGVGKKKTEIFSKILQQRLCRQGQVIADCLLRPSSKARSDFKQQISTKNSEFLSIPKDLPEPLLWMQYRRSEYVLSLQGNGYDCHRTWEAGLLGATVICDNTSISQNISRLPIHFIDDWKGFEGILKTTQRDERNGSEFKRYWENKIAEIRDSIDQVTDG